MLYPTHPNQKHQSASPVWEMAVFKSSMVQCQANEPFVKLLRAQPADDKGRWNLGSRRGHSQLRMEAPIGKDKQLMPAN